MKICAKLIYHVAIILEIMKICARST